MLKENSITKDVEDGTYFEKALDWYAFKFIYPYTIRSSLLLITLIIIFSAYTMFKVIVMDYQHKMYPFPIYAQDQVLYTPKIKSLSQKKEPINVPIARYLSSKYVIFRESYNAINFIEEINKENLFNAIQSLSSRKVYNDYIGYIDTEINPDSPIILYKNHTQRIIKIKDIELKGNSLKPDYAIITYEAFERSKSGEKNTVYKAEVDFMMSDIKKVFDKTLPLQFIVTRYRTYKL